MLSLNPYLNFDGNCADAMHFYERALDAKLEMIMRYSETPTAMQNTPGGDRIAHARLVIDGNVLMACDAMTDQPYQGMQGFTLALNYPTAAEAKRAFEALAKGGKVGAPLQETFWAEVWGTVVDRFGTPWMVNGGMKNPG